MDIQWDVLARIVNSLGCVVGMYILIRAATRQYGEWNFKTQNHWWALFGWVTLGLEGSIENLVQGNPPGPRTVIQTLVIAWTIRALTIRREKLEAEPAFPKKENEDER